MLMTARVPEAVSAIVPISGGATADLNRLYVSEHSAGDHLTAMRLPLAEVRGGIPISVIYDLEPIRLNYLNKKLGLDRGSRTQ
jgi:arylformamidase